MPPHGDEAYVFHAAMTETLAMVIVQPNGDRPIPDPLGCELGFYPAEKPHEIWVAELPVVEP